MGDQNLTLDAIRFYVVGERIAHTQSQMVTLGITKVNGGWSQDVLVGDSPELRVNYMSNQTRQDLNAWFVCDFKTRYRIFTAQTEALEHHAQKQTRLYRQRVSA